jgi:hypothetical protein
MLRVFFNPAQQDSATGGLALIPEAGGGVDIDRLLAQTAGAGLTVSQAIAAGLAAELELGEDTILGCSLSAALDHLSAGHLRVFANTGALYLLQESNWPENQSAPEENQKYVSTAEDAVAAHETVRENLAKDGRAGSITLERIDGVWTAKALLNEPFSPSSLILHPSSFARARALPLVKTIGGEAGRNYATIALFNAAWGVAADLPLAQTQNIEARIYGANADGSVGAYTAQVTVPTVTTSSYTLTYRGMLGSFWAGGQVKNSSTYTTFSTAYQGACAYLENIEFVVTAAGQNGIAWNGGNLHLNNVRCSAAGVGVMNNSSNGTVRISNSLLCSSSGAAVRSYYGWTYVSDSILYAPTAGALGVHYTAGFVAIDNCTIKGAYLYTASDGSLGFMINNLRLRNCIGSYSSGFSYNPASTGFVSNAQYNAFLSSLRDCNFHNSATGKFINGQTLAEFAGDYAGWYGANRVTSEDPLLVNASGTWLLPSDYRLSASSLCRRLNQSIRTSAVNPSAQIERVTPGAPIDSWDEDPLS